VPTGRKELPVAQGLDEKVGHGVVKVAGVDDEENAEHKGYQESHQLADRNFASAARGGGTCRRKGTVLVVHTEADAFYEGALGRFILLLLEQIV
jgi:hypothetical protein